MIAPVKKVKTDPTPNLSVANYLAQELDDDGRVSPVVWGLTDPVFREAALSGKIPHTPQFPDRKISVEAASALNAPYLLTYSTDLKNGNLVAHAEVSVEGRTVWKDDEQMASKHAIDTQVDDAAASVAHTWALQLESSVLKALKSRPKKATPTMSKGQDPPKVDSTPTQSTVSETEDQVGKLEAKGQVERALVTLRDAIDAHPLDASLRLLLVHVLERKGQVAEAARQAVQAAELIPDNRELRMAAIRDLLASDQKDLAKEQMNEIVARQPNDPASLLLRGQTELALGSPDLAMDPLDRLVRATPTSEAIYWRALARALLGGVDGVQSDARIYAKGPMDPSAAATNYMFAIDVFGEVLHRQLDLLPPLIQQESVHPDSAQVAQQVSQALRQCEAGVAFLSGFACPAEFKNSHGQRLLALKLLKVCLLDLQDFAKSNGDDVLSDARINLGEAMKQSKTADSGFAAERGNANHGAALVSSNRA